MNESKQPAVSPQALAIVANTVADRRALLVRNRDNAIGGHKDRIRQQLIELDVLSGIIVDALVKESY